VLTLVRVVVVEEQPASFRLELVRRLGATPERVFEMLTEPEQVQKWWGPHGFTMPEVRIDLRVGGGYHFTMQPPEGERFHLTGEFRAIEPPSRLVFTFRYDEPTPDDRETVVTLTLDPDGKRTRVSLDQDGFATEERVALHRGGWSDSFDRLGSALAQ